MEVLHISRGDIILVDFGKNVGCETNNLRPCLVVQNNIGNRHSLTTIVVPITSRDPRVPTHLKMGEHGENVTGVAMFEQIRVIDKTRIVKKLGVLCPSKLGKINELIRISLAVE